MRADSELPPVTQEPAAHPSGESQTTEEATPALDSASDQTLQEASTQVLNTSAEQEALAGCLPVGWEAIKDPTSGATYYHNATTQVTTWDKPNDASLTVTTTTATATATATVSGQNNEEEAEAAPQGGGLFVRGGHRSC